MSKKLGCLVLALMLMMTGVVYAEFAGSPSIGTSSVTTTTVRIVTKTGVVVGADFAVVVDEPTEFSDKALEEVAAYLATAGSNVVTYFPTQVQTAIASLLPAGANLANLKMDECMPLDVKNYQSSYGEVTVAFTFPTPYTLGQTVVAMVGIDIGGSIVWYALPATVNATGEVEITFPQEVMELVAANDAIMAILSDTVA